MRPLFPPDAVIRRVSAEGVLLLGGGRALLMQLAHPAVAQGVADHSRFERDPFGRLRRTLEASFAMVFGTEDEARRTASALRAIHDRVVGPGYRANDPELLMWVHATLVDTALCVYQRFVGPLSPADRARYYQESALVAELIGVPRDRQPADLATFRDYVRTMVGSLEVTDTARRLARSVLEPPGVPWPATPLLAIVRQLTIGLLPSPLRAQYGYGWDAPRQAALLTVEAASRLVLPRIPAPVRRVPALLAA